LFSRVRGQEVELELPLETLPDEPLPLEPLLDEPLPLDPLPDEPLPLDPLEPDAGEPSVAVTVETLVTAVEMAVERVTTPTPV